MQNEIRSARDSWWDVQMSIQLAIENVSVPRKCFGRIIKEYVYAMIQPINRNNGIKKYVIERFY